LIGHEGARVIDSALLERRVAHRTHMPHHPIRDLRPALRRELLVKRATIGTLVTSNASKSVGRRHDDESRVWKASAQARLERHGVVATFEKIRR